MMARFAGMTHRVGLRRCRRAVAAVQFAICTPVLLLFMAGVVDLGRANYGRARMESAVSAGVQYAYLTGATVTAANVKSMVEALADSTLNGATQVVATVTGPGCFCITGAVGSAAMAAQACNTNCADGRLSGQFVQISATYTFSPLLPGIANLVPSTLTTTALVQLK